MLDPAEVARVLDILGNRNRRRIIDLLRQKPCFVTEISERLTISPKAVIEHLQMMERENILSFRQDDRRRKYYFLANDITVVVNLQPQREVQAEETTEPSAEEIERRERLTGSIHMLRRMIEARQNLLSHLEDLDHDIDTKVVDLARNNRDIFPEERDVNLIIALCHGEMNEGDLREFAQIPEEGFLPVVKKLKENGIIEQKNGTYRLRGIYAE